MAEENEPIMLDGKTAYKKETFYLKMEYKLIKLRKLMDIYLSHAPNHEKYGLSLTIRNQIDLIYRLLIVAQKKYWNKTTIFNMNVEHEVLRGYVRLFYEMGYFNYRKGRLVTPEDDPKNLSEALRRFRNANVEIDILGKMIGGLDRAAKTSKEAVIEYVNSDNNSSENKNEEAPWL